MPKYYKSYHKMSGLKIGDKVIITEDDIVSENYKDVTSEQATFWNRQKLGLENLVGTVKADHEENGFVVAVAGFSDIMLPYTCLKKLAGTKYYMVHDTLVSNPTKMYLDINIAVDEAKRLAKENIGQVFTVLEAISSFEVVNPEPTETFLK